MQIEFDPNKDAGNQSKHGVSLSLASELDWEAALVWVDDRFEYGELRMIALAPKTGVLYYVVGPAKFISDPHRQGIRNVERSRSARAAAKLASA